MGCCLVLSRDKLEKHRDTVKDLATLVRDDVVFGQLVYVCERGGVGMGV